MYGKKGHNQTVKGSFQVNALLYSFRRCPYAMRGRMGLKVSGLDYEHREILLKDKPAHMLELSPKGTVPVFQTDDGQVIDESLDLLNFAIAVNDPLGWLNCDLASAKDLIAHNDGPFKHHLDRYKYASRYDEKAKRGDVDIDHRTACEKTLSIYETRLSNHEFLMGERQTIADIAIFPFIRQFANTDIKWRNNSPFPKTKSWLLRHTESELFLSIMKKFPLWEPPTSV